MPKVNETVPHQLGKATAREKLDGMMTELSEKYADTVQNLQGGWDEDTLCVSFTAYGFDISSAIEVRESEVDVRGEIPLAAVPFKGQIKKTIVSRLQDLLA